MDHLWRGFGIALVEFLALAFLFGVLTRYQDGLRQILLAVAGMGVLWLVGRVAVAVFGLDLSLNVRM